MPGWCRLIDLAAVDRVTKEIKPIKAIRRTQAPDQLMWVVRTGDVLIYYRFIDHLPLVLVVPPHLDGASVNYEFLLLRPKPSCLDSRFLYHMIPSLGFIHGWTLGDSKGDSWLYIDELRRTPIPAVCLEEQQKLAASLDKLEHDNQQILLRWLSGATALLYAVCEIYWDVSQSAGVSRP